MAAEPKSFNMGFVLQPAMPEKPDINLDNLDELIQLYSGTLDQVSALNKILDNISQYIESGLRKRHWRNYIEPSTNTHAELRAVKNETVDMRALKLIMPPSQLAQVLKTKSELKLVITTESHRNAIETQIKNMGRKI